MVNTEDVRNYLVSFLTKSIKLAKILKEYLNLVKETKLLESLNNTGKISNSIKTKNIKILNIDR